MAGVIGPTSFSDFSVVGLVTFLLKKEPKTELRLAFFSVGEVASTGVSSFFSSLLSETIAAGAVRVSQCTRFPILGLTSGDSGGTGSGSDSLSSLGSAVLLLGLLLLDLSLNLLVFFLLLFLDLVFGLLLFLGFVLLAN